jgi:hypothetical protein
MLLRWSVGMKLYRDETDGGAPPHPQAVTRAGVAVQLVLKPSVWSLNKISDLVGRLMD